MEKYLGFPIKHQKTDLDEIQSLDLREVVEHKVRQAYASLWKPVLVEDTSLEFCTLGKLPGTFIRFFIQEMWYEKTCRLLDGRDRSAIGRTTYAYFDGERLEFFSGMLRGTIAEKPWFDNWFGWDRIFIPEGYTTTRSELSEEDYKVTYLQVKPIEAVRAFLLSL